MMQIAAWLVVGWLFTCCAFTFSWCVLVEVCQRRARKHSGSFATEPERALPTARARSRAAGTRHLKIVP